MAETNVERARRGFGAALRGDLDELAALLAPDVKWHGGDPAAGCRDRGEALAFMRAAIDRGLRAELVDVIDAGERVVVLLRPGAEPETVRANVSTFRDGKVVEIVHHPDPRDAMAAVGAQLPRHPAR